MFIFLTNKETFCHRPKPSFRKLGFERLMKRLKFLRFRLWLMAAMPSPLDRADLKKRHENYEFVNAWHGLQKFRKNLHLKKITSPQQKFLCRHGWWRKLRKLHPYGKILKESEKIPWQHKKFRIFLYPKLLFRGRPLVKTETVKFIPDIR